MQRNSAYLLFNLSCRENIKSPQHWEVGSLQIKAVEQGTTQESLVSYMGKIGGNSVAPAIDNTSPSAEESVHAGSLFDL